MKSKKFVDQRGTLIKWTLDSSFKVNEIFMISDVPVGTIRGEHAHKHCDQEIILLKGLLKVVKEDQAGQEEILLNEESASVHLPRMTWSQQTFLAENTEVIVLSSLDYDENDYIRDYSEFKALSQINSNLTYYEPK